MGGVWDSVTSSAETMSTNVSAAVQGWVDNAVDWVTGMPERIPVTVNSWATGIMDTASQLKDTAAERVKDWADGVVGWVTGVPDRIPATANDWVAGIVNSAVGLKDGAAQHVKTWADNVVIGYPDRRSHSFYRERLGNRDHGFCG